jgi:hypothetical protein
MQSRNVLRFAAVAVVAMSHVSPGAQVNAAVPPSAVAEDAKPAVPGNPEKAIKDMALIRDALAKFRERHGGKMPADGSEFTNDLIGNPKVYGLRFRDLVNPDARHAANPVARNHPQSYFPFAILSKRPDGSPIGGPKKPGQRDILAICDLYAHLKIERGKGLRGADKVTPYGFYIVLWDDGQIARLPMEKRIEVKIAPGRWSHGFPGQAGVPKSAKTMEQKRNERLDRQQPPKP